MTTTDLDRHILTRIDTEDIAVDSPVNNYRIIADKLVTRPDHDRILNLVERGLVARADRLRGEDYPTDGWPQRYVLTDAGRAVLANATKEKP